MAIQREVKQMGGSVGVLIPRDIAEAMGVEAGSKVDLTLVNRQLVIEPTREFVDDATFRRAFAAVLQSDDAGFQWLADFDRGLVSRKDPKPAKRGASRAR